MWEQLEDREITFLDHVGDLHRVRYDELRIDLGERGGQPTLIECLQEEQQRVDQLHEHNAKFFHRLMAVGDTYEKQPRDTKEWHAECCRRTEGIQELPPHRQIELLNEYFCLDHQHRWLIEDLCSHLLCGNDEDHGGYLKTLLRFSLDYIMSVMRGVTRRNGQPAAMHPIAAARGAAGNGQNAVTIIGTLLHDVLEERLDSWTQDLLRRELSAKDGGQWAGGPIKAVPAEVRQAILIQHQEAYNDRAAQIYYSTALRLYDHVRKFPHPERYYQMLNSIMEVIARLSRTRDLSYYEYLQRFFYPKREQPDLISRETLLRELDKEFVGADMLLDEYCERVDKFYDTPFGNYDGGEEMQRNTLREILGKILDRLHNTRDMERANGDESGFSVPERIYGAGFKNLYFAQALEDRMVQWGNEFEARRREFGLDIDDSEKIITGGNLWTEGRLILSKFIKKPKIAALHQINLDLDYLADQESPNNPDFPPGTIARLERDLSRYKATGAFRKLTKSTEGSIFDGAILYFNEIILGRRQGLKRLESDLRRQTAYLLAFRAVFEELLVTSGKREEEIEEATRKHGRAPLETRWQHFRVEGMGPSMIQSYKNESDLPRMVVKSFRREIV